MMEQNIMLRPQMPNQSIVIFIAISRLTCFSLNCSGSLATKTGSSCSPRDQPKHIVHTPRHVIHKDLHHNYPLTGFKAVHMRSSKPVAKAS